MAQVEPDSWKEKYLLSLENFEKEQLAAEQRLDILRKGVVRMSLAADGLDEPLDEVLAELRGAIRKSDDVLELAPLIERLETCVVALDHHRKEGNSAAETLIDTSLASTLETKIARKDKSVIKSLRKKLPSMLRHTSINTELWQRYIEAQQPIFEHIKELEQGTKKSGGLFKNLFSSSNNTSQEISIEPLIETDSADIDNQENTETDNYNIDNNSDESTTQSHDGLEQVREELKSRTIQVFCGLVDKIETPNEFNQRKDNLVTKLQDDFEWQLLPDMLTEAMELVASTRKVAQLEFEGFLITLHERLHDIQDFLHVAREGEEQALLNQTKLDQEVRIGLKEIKASVDDALDISVLKDDITSMVNHIVDVIDFFHADEKNRRDEVYDRIEMLGVKMAEMETEASDLRNNLETQRIQAMRDPLTELPNRQAYDEQAEKEFSRWKRHQRPLSMAIVDIDHFKRINDTLGHLRGDKVLKLVAKEIQRNIRSEDFVCRFGGEEFVILMPDTQLDSALIAVEKVRSAVENCPFNFAGERVVITASFGVSLMVGDDTMMTCFDRMDKALYRAKESGRNKVESG